MIRRASSRTWRIVRWAGLAAAAPALWACTSRTLEAPTINPTAIVTTKFTQKVNNQLDILFMVDNSSSMTPMQKKLYAQLPNFMAALLDDANGNPLTSPPDLHVAVVSSDMGVGQDNGESQSIMCSVVGDDGAFQIEARSDTADNISCTNTTVTAGDNFLIDGAGMTNFTNPIGQVFQCIALLGEEGCGFEHQLASIDHALGADNIQQVNGVPTPVPPASNVGFLRPSAYLGIVLLTNEDDCSAPANTTLFELGNTGDQNLENPLGPVANYRCNQYGHLCKDPNSSDPNAYNPPPLMPPGDAVGTDPPVWSNLTCESNDTNGMTTPVSQFVSDIQFLKGDPVNDILVAAIIAPATPYAVEWDPAVGAQGPDTKPNELWPQVQHSCGPQGTPGVNPAGQNVADGSFGDPGVRITQFVNQFSNSLIGSICDADYSQSMAGIAAKLNQLIKPPCIQGTIQKDGNGNPECSVTENVTDSSGGASHIPLQNCATNNNQTPCFNIMTNLTGCTGTSIQVNDPSNASAATADSDVQCAVCLPGSTDPGCT